MTDTVAAGKILIFIVAYEARRHLRRVLDRIPAATVADPQVHILIIDDGSSDQGVLEARAWADEHNAPRLTILRNPVNQGYGGNQKLGYRIALEAGFDFVVLLHGDGQYAPELLPQFIATWRRTRADVVLGSRMTSLKEARAGGMPWHKMIGNRLLTRFQNGLTGRQLSEYHTGYRGYATAFLRRVPFERNTNDFHFDTEILLQAFHVRATLEEFGIPTHYGDEICRVNGAKYAWDVVRATVRFKLHQKGMLCDLKYRRLEPTRYEEKTFMAYSSHALAMEIVRQYQPQNLLDIGCGPGFIAKRCGELGIVVTGIDAFAPLPGNVQHFRQMNLETDPPPADAFDFDMVLLLDVIEHLAEPEQFLLALRNRAQLRQPEVHMPLMVISTPNIAFAAIRLNLLLGRFTYAERGILDITHKRLFTRKSLLALLNDCGYVVEEVRAAAVPFQAVMSGGLGKLLGWIAGMLARLWPAMFAFQFVVTCRPRPGVRQLVRLSEKYRLKDDAIADVLLRQPEVS